MIHNIRRKFQFCQQLRNSSSFYQRFPNNMRNRTAIIAVNGAHKRLIERTTNNLYRKAILARTILPENFMEKLRPVALEKHEFENRQNENNNWKF